MNKLQTHPEDYAVLEGHLGHTFREPSLLTTALTHKSYVNEKGGGRAHNERLEFLGDAVLGLMVAHLLMEACPDSSEGELSLMRSQVVSEPSLYALANQIGLGDWLYLGRGEEQTGGRSKTSLLADAYEAVLGALYRDAGFECCLSAARRLLGAQVERAMSQRAPDYKSALQELLQRDQRPRPRYELVATSGPDHEKTFEVEVYVDEQPFGRGRGRSKREAEHGAAAVALAALRAATASPQE